MFNFELRLILMFIFSLTLAACAKGFESMPNSETALPSVTSAETNSPSPAPRSVATVAPTARPPVIYTTNTTQSMTLTGAGATPSQPITQTVVLQGTAPFCQAGATIACGFANGTGSQVCNAQGSAYSACANLTSCNAGYNLQGGTCVAQVCSPNSSQACSAGLGNGTRTCNAQGTAYSACGNLTSCVPGFDLVNGTCQVHFAQLCLPNSSQVCNAGLGIGTRTCNAQGTAYSACGNLTSCVPGFDLVNGSCQVHLAQICLPNSSQACSTGIGNGTSTCNAQGSAYSACGNLTSCIPGFALVNGSCQPQICAPNATLACGTQHGRGHQSCDSTLTRTTSVCQAESCDPGYSLVNGSCQGQGISYPSTPCNATLSGGVPDSSGTFSTFTLSVDPSPVPVYIGYATSPSPYSPAVCNPGTCYQGTFGTLTFNPGDQPKTVRVNTFVQTFSSNNSQQRFVFMLWAQCSYLPGAVESGFSAPFDVDPWPQIRVPGDH